MAMMMLISLLAVKRMSLMDQNHQQDQKPRPCQSFVRSRLAGSSITQTSLMILEYLPAGEQSPLELCIKTFPATINFFHLISPHSLPQLPKKNPSPPPPPYNPSVPPSIPKPVPPQLSPRRILLATSSNTLQTFLAAPNRISPSCRNDHHNRNPTTRPTSNSAYPPPLAVL